MNELSQTETLELSPAVKSSWRTYVAQKHDRLDNAAKEADALASSCSQAQPSCKRITLTMRDLLETLGPNRRRARFRAVIARVILAWRLRKLSPPERRAHRRCEEINPGMAALKPLLTAWMLTLERQVGQIRQATSEIQVLLPLQNEKREAIVRLGSWAKGHIEQIRLSAADDLGAEFRLFVALQERLSRADKALGSVDTPRKP